MRKIISLIFIAILINLTILSISHGQANVNIGGIVPETEFNRPIRKPIKINTEVPSTGENKYLYFFEKALGLQEKDSPIHKNANEKDQFDYDNIYSSLLLWFLMLIAAILSYLILKISGRLFGRMKLSKKKLHHYGK